MHNTTSDFWSHEISYCSLLYYRIIFFKFIIATYTFMKKRLTKKNSTIESKKIVTLNKVKRVQSNLSIYLPIFLYVSYVLFYLSLCYLTSFQSNTFVFCYYLSVSLYPWLLKFISIFFSVYISIFLSIHLSFYLNLYIY